MKQFIENYDKMIIHVEIIRKRILEQSDRVSKYVRRIRGDATMIAVWRKILELAGDSCVTSHSQTDVTDALSISRTTYFVAMSRLVAMGALKRKGEGRGRGCRQTFIIVERSGDGSGYGGKVDHPQSS